jgi:hypothetical protein
MSIEVKSGGVWRTCEVSVKAGGSWRTIKQMWAKYLAGNWRLVYPSVHLDGHTLSANTQEPDDAITGLRFNTDGTVDAEIEVVGYSQIDSATDWVIPNSAAGSEYSVSYTALTGDAFTTAAAAEGSWVALSSNREWRLDNSTPGTTLSNSCTFRIKDNTNDVQVAQAVYNFTAQVDEEEPE